MYFTVNFEWPWNASTNNFFTKWKDWIEWTFTKTGWNMFWRVASWFFKTPAFSVTSGNTWWFFRWFLPKYFPKARKIAHLAENVDILAKSKVHISAVWRNCSQCRCDKFTGSGVSHGVSQWILVVLICTKSYQLKTKSNLGKFFRKCSFSNF